MILHSLTVSGLRCLRDPVSLDDLSEGVNIVQGPNESGKSTLVLGLVLAFLNRHDVSGEAADALRPWGTSLSPAVTVEFTAGGRRYRLEKRFLDSAASTLSEWNGRVYSRTAEGRFADDRVRMMMEAQFPARGLVRGPKFGLAHLLWMPQDAERFTGPALIPGVEGRFRAALGVSLLTREDDALIKRIDDMYGRIFTPARGDFQAGSDVARAKSTLDAIAAELDRAGKGMEDAARAVDELRAAETRHREASESLAAMKRRGRELKAEADRVRALKAQLGTAQVEEEMAARELERLRSEHQQVVRLTREAAAAVEGIRLREAALRERQAALDGVLASIGPRREELAKVQEALNAARIELRAAYDLDRARSRLAQVLALENQAEEARGLATEIRELQARLAQRAQPQPSDIKTATSLESRIRANEAQAQAAGIKISFQPYRETDVEIVSGGPEGTRRDIRKAAPNVPLEIEALDTVSLDIPNVGRLDIRSGSGDLRRLLDEAREDRKKLAEILARFGAESVDELRQSLERTRRQQDRLDALKARMGELVGAEGTVDTLEAALAQERAALESQLAALRLTRADLDASPAPATATADLAQLGRKVDELETQEATLTRELTGLAREEARLKDEMADVDRQVSGLRGAEQQASEDLSSRLAPFGGDEARLASALAAAEGARNAKAAEVERLRALIPADAGELEREAQRLDRRIEELERGEIPKLGELMGGLKAQIERAGSEGLYSVAAALEERHHLANAEYTRALRKARAIRVLYHLAHERREKLLGALAEPVREEVTRLFAQITANPSRLVELGPDLSLAGLRVGAGGAGDLAPLDVLPLDVLSVGAQEQLMMVMRLALGRFLGKLERQLVVLDDPLVNTDPERNSRVLGLLDAAADTLQLLILTCHPDRYDSLAARRFEMRVPGS